MWFSLLIVVLVLAVAFYQASLGLFNSLVMMVLSICCAAAAFGTYEWVAVNWLAPFWQPNCAAAIAMAATFAVPLLVLRVLADQLVRRSSLIPSWLDRIGGAICGLVTALVLVGVMAVALQMVPFDRGSILGYSRIAMYPWDVQGEAPAAPSADAGERDLWLKPDRFVAALAAHLSDGLFSSQRSFLEDNPDFVQAQGWLNAAPQGVARYAPPKSASVVSCEPVPVVYKYSPPPAARRDDPGTFELINPRGGHVFQMVRVQLKRAAMGPNRSHAFTLRQFRLVGKRPGRDESLQFYPVAIQQERDETPNRHVKLIRSGQSGFWPLTDRAMEPRDGNDAQVEVVFEVPDNFRPSYLEYKRGARMSVTFSAADSARQTTRERGAAPESTVATRGSEQTAPASSTTTAPSSSSDDESASRQRGRTRRFASREGAARFSDELPMALKAYRKLKNADTRRGSLVDGHLVGFIDEQEEGRDREVSRLRVPSDQRLLQLNADFLEARSGIGQVLSKAVATVQNYYVEDTNGKQYKVVGKYAIADVNGRRVFEVQYFSNPVGSMGGMGKFDEIDEDDDLKGDYTYVLLFLVDPGVKIKRFSTGGSSTQAEDLEGENLIAPE